MVLLYFREGKAAAGLSDKDLAVPFEIQGLP
jgi:hypothetical protein